MRRIEPVKSTSSPSSSTLFMFRKRVNSRRNDDDNDSDDNSTSPSSSCTASKSSKSSSCIKNDETNNNNDMSSPSTNTVMSLRNKFEQSIIKQTQSYNNQNGSMSMNHVKKRTNTNIPMYSSTSTIGTNVYSKRHASGQTSTRLSSDFSYLRRQSPLASRLSSSSMKFDATPREQSNETIESMDKCRDQSQSQCSRSNSILRERANNSMSSTNSSNSLTSSTRSGRVSFSSKKRTSSFHDHSTSTVDEMSQSLLETYSSSNNVDDESIHALQLFANLYYFDSTSSNFCKESSDIFYSTYKNELDSLINESRNITLRYLLDPPIMNIQDWLDDEVNNDADWHEVTRLVSNVEDYTQLLQSKLFQTVFSHKFTLFFSNKSIVDLSKLSIESNSIESAHIVDEVTNQIICIDSDLHRYEEYLDSLDYLNDASNTNSSSMMIYPHVNVKECNNKFQMDKKKRLKLLIMKKICFLDVKYKQTLRHIEQNDKLGVDLQGHLERETEISAAELDKYKLLVKESDVIINLLFKLDNKMANTQNSIQLLQLQLMMPSFIAFRSTLNEKIDLMKQELNQIKRKKEIHKYRPIDRI